MEEKQEMHLQSHEVQMFEHQVGGHGLGDPVEGILSWNGEVLKPLRPSVDNRSNREREFYQSLFGLSPGFASDLAQSPLRSFVPQYLGVLKIELGA